MELEGNILGSPMDLSAIAGGSSSGPEDPNWITLPEVIVYAHQNNNWNLQFLYSYYQSHIYGAYDSGSHYSGNNSSGGGGGGTTGWNPIPSNYFSGSGNGNLNYNAIDTGFTPQKMGYLNAIIIGADSQSAVWGAINDLTGKVSSLLGNASHYVGAAGAALSVPDYVEAFQKWNNGTASDQEKLMVVRNTVIYASLIFGVGETVVGVGALIYDIYEAANSN